MRLVQAITFYFLLIFANCFAFASGVKGVIRNSQSGQIFLYEFFGDVIIKADSATIGKNGNFSFTKKYPRGLYKLGLNPDTSAIIILSSETPEVSTSLPGFVKNFVIKNSEENKLLKEYLRLSASFSGQVNSLQKRYDQASAMAEQNPTEYEKVVNRLKHQYDSLNKIKNVNFSALKAKNPSSFTAKIAAASIISDTVNAKNFLTHEDLNDPEMTRGDMLSNKIKSYFQMFVQPQEQALSSAVNDVLLKMPVNSPNREVAFISMLVLFNQFTSPLNKQIKSQYTSEYPNSKYAKVLLPQLRQDPPDVGDVAPDISMADSLGKTIKLSSFRGKVVLLDFWASWCGPCRMENPNVVKAYNRFKDKGFTIYSVSLDNSREKWLGAIRKDNLTWTHVTELKGWETSANRLYQVTGIPATFLIDKEGKIVGKNLRGPALENALEKLLGTN